MAYYAGIFSQKMEFSGIYEKEREIRKVTNLLSNAIKNDGKGEPLPETLSGMICKNAKRPVFAMGSTNQDIIAYHVQEEVVVTHNNRERKELEKRFRRLKCTELYSLEKYSLK